MKKVFNIYDKELTLANIYDCYLMVKKARKNKKEVFNFDLKKNINLYYLYTSLKKNSYKFTKYKLALITEPKYRLIMSEYLNDKIINHFVAKYYLIKYLEPSLIDANVATRADKGGAYGYKLFTGFINKIKFRHESVYCLKIDIKKYFYNIDHEILMELIAKKIQDEKVLKIVRYIIDSSNDEYINNGIIKLKNLEINRIKRLNISVNEKEKKIEEISSVPEYKKGKGLPIGNMTSQIMAIYYLNEVDHYIKSVLKIKYYVRYMDDLVIIHHDREYLKEIMETLKNKIAEYKLEINNKSRIYDLTKGNGVSFLGYRYSLRNQRLIIKYHKQTIQRVNKRLKDLKKHDIDKYILSISSYKGYLQKCNSNLYKNKYEKIWSENMKIIEKSKKIKEDNEEKVVIIREGSFYKCSFDDAIILWHLFDYRITNDVAGFPIGVIDKVIQKLVSNGIGYIVVDEGKEADGSNYNSALSIAKYCYDRHLKRSEIVKLLDECTFNNLNKYDEIITFIKCTN